MKKQTTTFVLLFSLISIVGIGLLPRPATALYNTWDVAVGDEFTLETSIVLSAAAPAAVDTLLDPYLPDGYDIDSLLNLVEASYEFKMTITAIQDAACIGVPTGLADLVNATIQGRVKGTSTWLSAGSVAADYVGKVATAVNLVYSFMSGSPLWNTTELGYLQGNLTAMSLTNVPVSCWVNATAMFDEMSVDPAFTAGFPLSTIPLFQTQFASSVLIIPHGVDFSSVYSWVGDLWDSVIPLLPYPMNETTSSLNEMLNAYGSYLTVGARDVRMGWSLDGARAYLQETLGVDYVDQFSDSAVFDIGAYAGYDENGVLGGSCLYMDASVDLDLTYLDMEEMNGVYSFSAALITKQPTFTVPTKEQLYVKKGGIPGYPIAIICIVGLASVAVILLRLKRRT